ncbi:unnamed protein product [Chrysodeixis includens]|uniref:gamma-glutamylcyclotransferase n=1 Tax=Chrysodeixis includens TaxID=689277 RepID=A0A9P0BMU0_CHRIL|nr:unnamed protein product [Chrysodeixis includens]
MNLLLCFTMVHSSRDYFLYFAYGSNLLRRRIRINNPSAEFVGIGLLENHQLDFVKYYGNWGGAVATAVPRPSKTVWGAIWKMHMDDQASLDMQEGVANKEYFAKMVQIYTPDGIKTKCRTYQHTFTPQVLMANELLPYERRPSITYKEVIVQGAIECSLPTDYIEMLKLLPHNGRNASDDIRKRLGM